ncbi:uncharacterized protein LOC129590909 [Paramacrobiotus metropolitanus]|uniref:uncharacterized protein LOC129590909 n=1 Tax=Paramacrobiotus metropolitanus TaxID=2943436 RepID=UPI002445B50A|nr:uncharacterized protein LOC129590909 [Paramacrobiotus metropolitanus]
MERQVLPPTSDPAPGLPAPPPPGPSTTSPPGPSVPPPPPPPPPPQLQIQIGDDLGRIVHQSGNHAVEVTRKRKREPKRAPQIPNARTISAGATGSVPGYLPAATGNVRRTVNLDRLLSAHVSESTRKTYDAAFNQFAAFCNRRSVNCLPAIPDTVAEYVAHLFTIKKSFRTVTVYLAGIHNRHREADVKPPTDHDLVVRALQGYRRLAAPRPDTRQPVTLQILRRLKHNLRRIGISPFEQSLLWAVFTVLYFGFLRIGEVTSPRENRYDPQHTLMREDLTDCGNQVVVRLKITKTDQTGQGCTVALAATGRSVCPVQAYRKYLAHAQFMLPAGRSPLFVHQDGRFLTRRSVEASLHRLLEGHPDQHRINTHSFRIGAATTAASNNVPDRLIQRAGRWKSSCYARYIRNEGPVAVNHYHGG